MMREREPIISTIYNLKNIATAAPVAALSTAPENAGEDTGYSRVRHCIS
jgi:hypothetical protein